MSKQKRGKQTRSRAGCCAARVLQGLGTQRGFLGELSGFAVVGLVRNEWPWRGHGGKAVTSEAALLRKRTRMAPAQPIALQSSGPQKLLLDCIFIVPGLNRNKSWGNCKLKYSFYSGTQTGFQGRFGSLYAEHDSGWPSWEGSYWCYCLNDEYSQSFFYHFWEFILKINPVWSLFLGLSDECLRKIRVGGWSPSRHISGWGWEAPGVGHAFFASRACCGPRAGISCTASGLSHLPGREQIVGSWSVQV